jgi:erythromycin esterase
MQSPALRICLLHLILPFLSCADSGPAAPPTDEQTSWVQDHAVRINSPDPAISEPNLAVLKETIGDARIVGLGEGTHGTAEFWDIRQKISQYLVEEMGFTAILFEAGFPNSLFLDEYVTEGASTLVEAHQKLRVWRYQEMRDLISWMRSYNEERGSRVPPLRFFGYDCAFRDWDEAIEIIEGYLEEVDPAAAPDIRTRLENYTLEDAQYVEGFFLDHAEAFISRSGQKDFDLHFRVVENLAPSWTVWYNLLNGLPDLDVRDAFNVENVEWIVENLLGGGKAIIWAHNGHVGNTYLDDGGGSLAEMLGARLRERFGEEYYVVATEFYGGRFLAWDACPGHARAFIPHQAAIPPADSYAFRFHAEGVPLFYLNLRGVDYSDPGSSWLMGPRRMRFIGASYCEAEDAEFYRSVLLPQEYDGVLFLDGTSPTTPVTF